MPDPFDLNRFIEAQSAAFAQATRELAQGRKTSHWMWFVFPQLRGLGSSAMASRFAIASLDEARAYLAHPLLGPRLKECVRLALRIHGRSIQEILGSPDDLKFGSCMTLFARAAPHEPLFEQALQTYFAGQPDARTLQLLAGQESRAS